MMISLSLQYRRLCILPFLAFALLLGQVGMAAAIAPDRYEPNNTLATATQGLFSIIGGTGAATKSITDANIHTVSTSDFYQFSVTQPGSLKMTLDKLPSDYRLHLYQFNSSKAAYELIAYNMNSGTAAKVISKTLAIGSYIVNVLPSSTASASATPYRLTLEWSTAAAPSLVVSPTTWSVEKTGGFQEVAVTSSSSWTAVSSQSWLILDKVGGSASDTTLSLTAVANPTVAARTATITLAAGTAKATVTVTQAAGPATELDYLLVDLSGGPSAASYPVDFLASLPATIPDLYKTSRLVLRRIPAGEFTMGSPATELGRGANETQHQVAVTRDFYVGIFEVTQKQWALVTGGRASAFAGELRPVESLSWDDIRGGTWPDGVPGAATFLGKLKQKTGLVFDLPTEAQWEYACRAGTTTALNSGDNLTSASKDGKLNLLGRYYYNQNDAKNKYTQNHTNVGSYQPNAKGLYDMHGNVWEWCLDWEGAEFKDATDPVGQVAGKKRIVRSGGWGNQASSCRSASRSSSTPATRSSNLGFRIVRSAAALPVTKLAVSPSTWQVPREGGGLSIVLASNNAWTAVSDQAWLSMDKASGKNDDRIGLAAAPNMTATARTATVTFTAGTAVATVVVTQAAGPAQGSLYLVIDLSGGATASSYPVTSLSALPTPIPDDYRTSKLVLRRIPGGFSTLGSPVGELGRSADETQYSMMISKDYYIGVFEVTQKQWDLVMGTGTSSPNPSLYKGAMRPVERVSWTSVRGGSWSPYDYGYGYTNYGTPSSTSFIGLLNARTGLSLDLPTEAQWEYACRAGTDKALNNNTSLSNVETDANLSKLGRYYADRADGKGGYAANHTKAGSYLPNAWGLYDMHGNVWEWCLDWVPTTTSTSTAASTDPIIDPSGPSYGTNHRLRGGSWTNKAAVCRSAARSQGVPDTAYNSTGFRLSMISTDSESRLEVYPKTLSFTKAGGSSSVKVVCSSTRPWYAVSSDPDWLMVSSYGNIGNGSLYVYVAANPGLLARTGTLTLTCGSLTRTVTVTQEPGTPTYIVVDVSDGPEAVSYPISFMEYLPETLADDYKTTKIIMRRVAKGAFTMGSPASEYGRYYDETAHKVTLTHDYYVGVFEVTQKQWALVMGTDPSQYKGDMRPVERVSWNSVRGGTWPSGVSAGSSFMSKLSKKAGLDFDLPTEAQWEYACRAGTKTALNSGKDLVPVSMASASAAKAAAPVSTDANLDPLGRYAGNQTDKKGGEFAEHTTVGSYNKNDWGLYDMHGNVDELCLDYYDYAYGSSSYFSIPAMTDPVGALVYNYYGRVVRGGNWNSTPSSCRSASRDYIYISQYYETYSSSTGFRIVHTRP